MLNISKSLVSLFNRPSFHKSSIDGVRAIAVILVIIGHVFFFQGKLFPEISSYGGYFRADLGVDLFFTISGFLIGTLLFKEYQKTNYISFKTFYLRRFLRLMPVYLVAMFFGIFLLQNNPLAESGGSNAQNMWANILYVNNFLDISRQFMGWCWSLAIEEQFYILIPGLLLFLLRSRRNKLNTLIYFLIFSCAIRFFVVFYYNFFPSEGFWGVPGSESWNKTFSLLYDNLHTRYGGLLIGVIGAYFYVYNNESLKTFFKNRKSIILNYVAIITFLMVFFRIDFFYFSEFTPQGLQIIEAPLSFIEKILFAFTVSITRNLFSLATIIIVLSSMFSKDFISIKASKFLSSKFFYPIAQLSYSAYLMHEMIQIWIFPKLAPIFKFLFNENNLLALCANGLVSIILTFISAFILYIFIERPFMEFRNSETIMKFLNKSKQEVKRKELIAGIS